MIEGTPTQIPFFALFDHIMEKHNLKNDARLYEFFDKKTCDSIIEKHGKADLITACNVFAHIPDLINLIKNVRRLLGEDGVFISESHYLDSLIETLQFDTIYHEHLRYYSIEFLKTFFESHKLTVFRIDKIPTHGGSIRVWASKSPKIL